MKFRITGAGWPRGDMLCPAGTVLDYDKPDHWTVRAKGMIPITATPLDQQAYDAQQRAYSEHRHLLGSGLPSPTSK